MRPAGMSSDEEDEDELFGYEASTPKKPKVPIRPTALPKFHNEKHSRELSLLLERDRGIAELHAAVMGSDIESVERLLQKGVPVDGTSGREWTPLMKACSRGDFNMVRYLLQHGANPKLHKELCTPIMACCGNALSGENDRVECLQLLLQFGANPNAKDKHNSTALIQAANNGLLGVTNVLLSTPDIDINAQDKEGWTALFHAVCGGHREIVKKLMDAGADVYLKDSRHGHTAIDIAITKNYMDIAETLGYTESELLQLENQMTLPADPLEEFLSELPDSQGNGGFSSDVKHILSGVGFVHLHKKLKGKVNLPDFLNSTDGDLFNIGVKFAPTRRKILNGIHKYHLRSWKKSSMHQLAPESVNLEDVVYVASNLVKHLCIVHATLRYVKSRISEYPPENQLQETNDTIDFDLLTSLIASYEESEQLTSTIERLNNQVNQIKVVGSVQADHVSPDEYLSYDKSPWTKYLLGTLTTAAVGFAVYYFKAR